MININILKQKNTKIRSSLTAFTVALVVFLIRFILGPRALGAPLWRQQCHAAAAHGPGSLGRASGVPRGGAGGWRSRWFGLFFLGGDGTVLAHFWWVCLLFITVLAHFWWVCLLFITVLAHFWWVRSFWLRWVSRLGGDSTCFFQHGNDSPSWLIRFLVLGFKPAATS